MTQSNTSHASDDVLTDQELAALLAPIPSSLHSPPGPDEPTDEQLAAEAKSHRSCIWEGDTPNAPSLRTRPGGVYQVRFLPFSERQRLFSTSARHTIFRHGLAGCPRCTDPELGGREACPICEAERAEWFPEWLTPKLLFTTWTYVVLLTRNDASRQLTHDPEEIPRVYRLRLELRTWAALRRAERADPLIADLDQGTDFEMRVSHDGLGTLQAIRRGPLQLSTVDYVRRRQLHRIACLLSEPHMWVERHPKEGCRPRCGEQYPVDDQAVLEHCVKYLRAHRDAPGRFTKRFWAELMAGSLPPLERLE